MQSIDEMKKHHKVIEKTCYIANIAYLIMHLLYFLLFIEHTYILMYINAFCVLTYCLAFILIKKKKYYYFALCCGNIFIIFMSAATILCGMKAGFQLTLIGLCVVSFFTTYFSKARETRKSIIWTILSAIIYIGLNLYLNYHNPKYILDKRTYIILYTAHSIISFGIIVSYLVIFLDYAMNLEKRIIVQSRTDELTKLHNRYDLYNYLESIDDKTNTFLSIYDIDDFKKINDYYGHVCGDFVLKELADISNSVLNDSFLSRYGGEEFIIITKNTNKEAISEKLEELRKVVECHNFIFNGEAIHVTITIGSSEFIDGISIEGWIEKADSKMYQGKENGKNQLVI